jgi:hypothetical protein
MDRADAGRCLDSLRNVQLVRIGEFVFHSPDLVAGSKRSQVEDELGRRANAHRMTKVFGQGIHSRRQHHPIEKTQKRVGAHDQKVKDS